MPIDYTKRPAAPAPATPSGAGTSSPVSLSKLTLTKATPSVSLTKQGAAGGVLRVNLNWNSRPAEAPKTGGLLKRLAGAGSTAIDLDLGCLYEYTDGSRGVVQALGNTFRDEHSFGPEPICYLDGDDRSGSVAGGETLYVNLAHEKAIRRVLVFAFIYEGVANWAAADAVVTLFPVAGPQIEIRLDQADPQSRMCAIFTLESKNGELSVLREVRYIQGGQRHLDEAYGWGMEWAAGRK